MEQYLQKWRLSPAEKLQTEKPSSSSGFECNICLDIVKDPVVTFCGHLYCWPCIYRWISFHENNDDQTVEYYLGRQDSHHKKPQCPVCKSHVSEKTLIPLYGQNPGDELSHHRLVPERRPSSPRCGSSNNSVVHRNNFVQPYYSGSYLGGGIRSTHLFDPMVGETTLYAYPNSYELAGSASPRLRRYMKRADESLSRVCCFLWCCAILCLLLF